MCIICINHLFSCPIQLSNCTCLQLQNSRPLKNERYSARMIRAGENNEAPQSESETLFSIPPMA